MKRDEACSTFSLLSSNFHEVLIDRIQVSINEQLLPAIIGNNITDLQKQIYKLPRREIDLGFPIIREKAVTDFKSSIEFTAQLTKTIINQRHAIPS